MSMQNINSIKIIINEDIFLKQDIDNILSFTKKINNSIYPQLYSILNIKNTKDIIKHYIFLQIMKSSDFSFSEENVDNIIFKIYKLNNINENILKKNFLIKNINYQRYFNILKEIILINILKIKLVQKDINIYDEEINSLTNQLYQKSKNRKIYNITIFYFLINKKSLKNNFHNKIILLNQLVNILKNKKLNNNTKKYNIKIFISHFNIKKIILKNIENKLSKNIINYLDNSKKKDVIGPIYLNSKLLILQINNIKLIDNLDNEKVLLRFIFIKKKNLSNKDFYKKINNIYFNILKKKITFKKAAQLFSDDIITIKYGDNKNWILLNNFSPKFKKIIKKLKINEFSLPIKESDSFFIIQLLDKKNILNNKLFFKKKAYQIILTESIEKEADLLIYEKSQNMYIKNII
ncbi:peptidylprolyl isomerase [Enterobacteriaceae endosymbiont of Donacia sparganii]|uniref:peptidylprolyl isomerase n=1 Tax=Enterobacteriaceae endosymbiont of Donacia sparganii TaxID=2675785 RepID=UPI00145738BC|nr:peptidylprolyl isomerase [Enterobacteriaceae endosymbiont of Donacia sparganii]